jgi:hypothetical protein
VWLCVDHGASGGHGSGLLAVPLSRLQSAVQRAQRWGAEPDLPAQASRRRDIIAFVVFCRLRYRLTLRDLSEILLLRGIVVGQVLLQSRYLIPIGNI